MKRQGCIEKKGAVSILTNFVYGLRYKNLKIKVGYQYAKRGTPVVDLKPEIKKN